MFISKNVRNGLIFSGGLAFVAGCSLDDPGTTNHSPALTLHAEQNLSLVTLSWDPVNVTGFKEYILLQSTSDIPNNPTPEVTAETTVLKRIDNRDQHTFSATNTLFAKNLCYKLYTSVDDRFLYSSTVCIDQDFTVFNGFDDRGGHEPGSDKEVLFDRLNFKFNILDYKTGVISGNFNDNNVTFPIINVSTLSGTTNVFAYDQSPPRILKYSFPEFSQIGYKDFPNILYALNFYKTFIFVSVDDISKSFQVLSRNNLSLIDSRSGITGNRNLAVFDGDPLIVLEIGESSMMRYSIDLTGKITKAEQLLTGVSQLNTQNTTAENNDYIICGRLGTLVNRDGDILANLTSGVNTFITMTRFSPDGSKVVSIVNDNNKVLLTISDVSALPLVTQLNTFELPQATYTDVIIDDHIIYVIGVTFTSGISQTFILKYPI